MYMFFFLICTGSNSFHYDPVRLCAFIMGLSTTLVESCYVLDLLCLFY